MKKKLDLTLVLFLVASVMLGCDKKEIAEDPTESQPGEAAITLTAGNSTFNLKGPCGWAKAAGVNYIGANHADNSLRTFSANFNIGELPAETTTYTLVKSDLSDEDPTHVYLSLTQITGTKLFNYVSSDASGKLTLVVEGNKVTVNLAGIVLQPEITQGFPTENVGDFAKPGTLSGTLTFYRK